MRECKVEKTVNNIGKAGGALGYFLNLTVKKVSSFFVGLFVLVVYGTYAFFSEFIKSILPK